MKKSVCEGDQKIKRKKFLRKKYKNTKYYFVEIKIKITESTFYIKI